MMTKAITSADCFNLTPYFEAFADRTRNSMLPPLHKITTVGARLTDTGLSPRDTDILRASVAYLLKTGLPVARDFKIRPVNLEYGEDFLEKQPPTDLLILSFVFNTSLRKWNNFAYRQRLAQHSDPCFFSLSHRHFTPGAWSNAAKASGAQIAVSFGNPPIETTIDKFCRVDWFLAVKPGSVWHGAEIPEARSMHEKGTFNNPCPQSFFGFALRRDDYLENALGHVYPRTVLGARIRESAQDKPGLLTYMANKLRLG